MKLKVSLLTVAVGKLKTAANVDIFQIAMGNATGNLGDVDLNLKVYVKPYSVFTGGKFVFQTFIPAILQLYQTSHIKETSQMKEWQKLQVAGIAQLPVPVISTAMVEVPLPHCPVVT